MSGIYFMQLLGFLHRFSQLTRKYYSILRWMLFYNNFLSIEKLKNVHWHFAISKFIAYFIFVRFLASLYMFFPHPSMCVCMLFLVVTIIVTKKYSIMFTFASNLDLTFPWNPHWHLSRLRFPQENISLELTLNFLRIIIFFG